MTSSSATGGTSGAGPLHAPPGAPPPRDTVPDATVRAVVSEVALETVAECTAQAGPRNDVEYVTAITAAACAAALECLPLWLVLQVPPDVAGHLHRNATAASATTSDQPVGLPVVLDLVAALISSRVARDLLDVRLERALHDVTHLQIAQASNRTIGVAVGVLMATRRCSAEAAFELLRLASQHQNRKLRDVAAEVPYTGTIPDDRRRPAATGPPRPGGPYRPLPPG